MKRLLCSLVMLFAIILSTGCSIQYGLGGNELRKEDAKFLTMKKTVVEEFSKLNVNTGFAEVHVLPGDDYYAEIDYTYWEEEPEFSIEDGVLRFDDSRAFPRSYSIRFPLKNTIKIYLPEEAYLDYMTIENSSGNVKISGSKSERLDINVPYGELVIEEALAVKASINISSGHSKVKNLTTSTLKYSNSYGNASFKNINTGDSAPEDYKNKSIDIKMSSGNCTIDNVSISTMNITNSYGNITCEGLISEEFDANLSSGNLKITKSDIQEIDVSNSYGNVTLSLMGKEDDFTLDLKTSYGKIKVGDKKYEGNLTRENNGTRSIITKLSSGDIDISFH